MPSNQVLSIPVATDASWTILAQTVDSLGNASAASGMLATDALEAIVWQGDMAAQLFTPTATWADAPNAKITLTVAKAQTATFAAGFWPIEVAWLPGAERIPVFGGWFELTDAPGSGTLKPTYSTYQDAVQYGGAWLKPLLMEQGVGSMLFQLARARSRLDEVIVGHWRRRVGRRDLLMDPSIMAPTEAPNQTIINYLASNYLMIRDRTVEICSHLAIGYLCEKQFAGEKDDPYLGRARYHLSRASNLMKGYRAELDVNADGLADIVVPCTYFSTR